MNDLRAKLDCEIHEKLDVRQASIEASRCYYCYDAPCIEACPTGIDIPSFIRKIGNGNIRGAAMDILDANILGGTCARACPVETLCQEACVREAQEEKPVQIGLLQRYATDEFFKTGEQPFKRAAVTGKRVAVIGAGPAGLSCAHQLARLGHIVVVFEAREKSGGLNEYGLAAYKMVEDFAQQETRFVLSIGGIEVRHGQRLGREFTLETLKKDYDAVFLGMGLGSTNALKVPGEELGGVIDAVEKIAEIRQARDLSTVAIGRNVVVIGGGNTAVDIAIQAKRLGAEHVTLAYRRGEENMGATGHERELARLNGVLIETWAKPIGFEGDEAGVKSATFERKGATFTLEADQVFKAIGQKLVVDALAAGSMKLDLVNGKIAVDERFESTIKGVFAGGDCIERGEDLTVTAVSHGKKAALAIHASFEGVTHG